MRRLLRFPGRLARANDGAAAVEFAVVALPFFLMLFAIMELGLLLLTTSTLEAATTRTARMIRTGEAQATGISAAQFKARVCRDMGMFAGDCSSRLFVDVRELPRFRSPSLPDPTPQGSFPEAFQTGQAGSIVLVRVWFKHPLFTTFLSDGVARYGSGDAVLTFTTSFRNEPFGT